VLIARVHPEILRSEGLPTPRSTRRRFGATGIAPSWISRDTSTATEPAIIRFYLHLSKEEQRKRFLERIDEPEKNWKFSVADVAERNFWMQYMKAYEECLGATEHPGRALVCHSRR